MGILNIAIAFWIIDEYPNLKWIFVSPIIIFSELMIPIYGAWYNPKSTTFELLNTNKKTINEIKIIYRKVFIFLSFKM